MERANRRRDSVGQGVRPSIDLQLTIPLDDAVDRLFRGETSIPAPAVEEIPNEVEISRLEAAARRSLFSQDGETAPVEATVPPPPPPVGRENLRESLDSLPPTLALPTPPEDASELDVSAPGELRDELDTSRPPPMPSATGSMPAFGITGGPLPAPSPESALEDDEAEFAPQDEPAPRALAAPEPSRSPGASANATNTKSIRPRVVVLGAGVLALAAVAAWVATALVAVEAPPTAREPAPAPPAEKPREPAPPVAKTEPAAAKASATEPSAKIAPDLQKPPEPAPPVAKVETPPAVSEPKPAESPLPTAATAPAPVAKPSQASSTAASPVAEPVVKPPRGAPTAALPAPRPAAKRLPAPLDQPVAKPRPARAPASPAPAPEPAASTTAKISASEAAQTVAAARRKLGEDDAEGAEELMRQLLQHEPHNDQALDVLARSLIDQDRGAAAAAVAEKLVALRPRTVAYWLLLGDALLMKGDDARAKTAWRKALELRPGDPGATQRLGL